MKRGAQVACLMPVRNGGSYLVRAIESVQAQTMSNWTLIIVDNGSTDGTPAVLTDFAARDPRIQVVYEAEPGIVPALNAGLSLVEAPFLARLDADDMSLPDRFARQVEALERNPELVAVGGGKIVVDTVDRPIRTVPIRRRPGIDLDVSPPRVRGLTHSSAMIRTEAIVRIGGYRRAFPYAEDQDLWLRLAEVGSFGAIRDPVICYRTHGTNASVQHAQRQAQSSMQSILAALCRHHGIEELDLHGCALPTEDYIERLSGVVDPVWLKGWVAAHLLRGPGDGRLLRHLRRPALRYLLSVSPRHLTIRHLASRAHLMRSWLRQGHRDASSSRRSSDGLS